MVGTWPDPADAITTATLIYGMKGEGS